MSLFLLLPVHFSSMKRNFLFLLLLLLLDFFNSFIYSSNPNLLPHSNLFSFFSSFFFFLSLQFSLKIA